MENVFETLANAVRPSTVVRRTKDITLLDVLSTQNYSLEHAKKICEHVDNDTFVISLDPISGIIINAFEKNEQSDYDGIISDLELAINRLQKAKDRITNRSF